jgi:hypothetical protein
MESNYSTESTNTMAPNIQISNVSGGAFNLYVSKYKINDD